MFDLASADCLTVLSSPRKTAAAYSKLRGTPKRGCAPDAPHKAGRLSFLASVHPAAVFALASNSDEPSDYWRSTSLLDDDREISICELLEWDEEIVPRFAVADILKDFGAESE